MKSLVEGNPCLTASTVLYRTMYAILMLLPQGDAFKTLSTRMSSLPGPLKSSEISLKKINELSSKERVLHDAFVTAQLERCAAAGDSGTTCYQ